MHIHSGFGNKAFHKIAGSDSLQKKCALTNYFFSRGSQRYNLQPILYKP